MLPRPVRAFSSRTKSSTQWLQRQNRDIYVKQAKTAGFLSRAAYKLLHLNREFKLIQRGDNVVDLGAAPGGWTQVAVKKSGSKQWDLGDYVRQRSEGAAEAPVALAARAPLIATRPMSVWALPALELAAAIRDDSEWDSESDESEEEEEEEGAPKRSERINVVVSVDLLPLPDIRGSVRVIGDFTHTSVQQRVEKLLPLGYADVVLSDMAHNFMGIASADHIKQLSLVQDAYTFAKKVLRSGGHFAFKVFQGGGERELITDCKANFQRVEIVKPPSSRSQSAEVFVVCKSLLRRPKR